MRNRLVFVLMAAVVVGVTAILVSSGAAAPAQWIPILVMIGLVVAVTAILYRPAARAFVSAARPPWWSPAWSWPWPARACHSCSS